MTLLWRPIRRSAGSAGSGVSCTGSSRAPREIDLTRTQHSATKPIGEAKAALRSLTSFPADPRTGPNFVGHFAGDPAITPHDTLHLNQVSSSQKGSLPSKSVSAKTPWIRSLPRMMQN